MRLPRKDLNALADRAAGSSSTRTIRETVFDAHKLGLRAPLDAFDDIERDVMRTVMGGDAKREEAAKIIRQVKAEIEAKIVAVCNDADQEARR